MSVQRRPSIILVSIDCLRPDHLGCYGYQRNTSPNIDRIAQSAVLFSQAISQGTYTVSALTCLATSSYLFQHDLYEHMLGVNLNREIPTLSEILKEEGYRCAFFGPWMGANIKNFQRGFDLFDIGPVGRKRFVWAGLKRLSSSRCDSTGASAITTKAINWLKARKDQPSFLWLHYFDAHPPYRVRPPFNRVFVGDSFQKEKLDKPFVLARLSGFGGIPKFIADNNQTNINYYIAKYDGAIRFIDAQVGRLWEFLQAQNLDEQAIIIITSDHGEFLGENDFYFCHGGLPLEPLVKIPLIIRYPALIKKFFRVDAQVQSIDIPSTIRALLDIRHKYKMRGNDLFSFLKKESNLENPLSFFWARYICAVRRPEWKLIYIDREALVKRRADLERLADKKGVNFEWKNFLLAQLDFLFKGEIPRYIFYDLQNDPEEKSPLLDSNSRIPLKAKSILDSWMRDIREKDVLTCADFSSESLERLRSLGYVQ